MPPYKGSLSQLLDIGTVILAKMDAAISLLSDCDEKS
jgi:hypothetical protein